jgi:hypothetical protein
MLKKMIMSRTAGCWTDQAMSTLRALGYLLECCQQGYYFEGTVQGLYFGGTCQAPEDIVVIYE